MLEFKDSVFRQGTFELHVDWSLPEQSRLAVIGPSGAGKSTLLAGVAGFLEQQSGQLLWRGEPMPEHPAARPVAMLFQDHNLFPHLTVAQNVGLGLRPSLKLSATENTKISQALSKTGLDGFESLKPFELSGGQQSRVALARILVMARPIILLDEPFSALGPAQRQEMLGLVRDVAKDLSATLIMVTHSPDEAQRLGGRVCFVNNGRVPEPVSIGAFFDDPPAELRAYLGN